MKSKLLTLACVTSLFIASQQVAVADAFADENFSGSVTFTSDYMFRGVTQTDEDPAIQGSLDWAYNGFYAGIWGSNIDFEWEKARPPVPDPNDPNGDPITPDPETGTHSVEYDLYLGYANSFGPVDYDAAFVFYWYPNDRGDNKADYVEFILGLSHTFDTFLSPTIGVTGAYTPDATLEDDSGTYIRGSLGFEVLEDVGLDFAVGFVDVDGDKTTPDGYGYTHYEFGATTAFKGFDLDLRYHTNNDQKSFGEIDQKLVFSVSRTFGG